MARIDKDLRQTLVDMARQRRDLAAQALGTDGALAAMRHFLRRIPLAPGSIVAGYWPVGAELDPIPLLARLRQLGHTSALPYAGTAGEAMIFRAFDDDTELEFDSFDVPAPAAAAPAIRPDVVICPMLAFDQTGARLGYSAGFYGDTLRALRRDGPVIAVGYAYQHQAVAELPTDPEEPRVDWIVTEAGAIRCQPPG